MAKKFVKVTGLNKVFDVSTDNKTLNTTKLKSSVSSTANDYSILYITATSADETYGYKSGSTYTWANGVLVGSSGSSEAKDTAWSGKNLIFTGDIWCNGNLEYEFSPTYGIQLNITADSYGPTITIKLYVDSKSTVFLGETTIDLTTSVYSDINQSYITFTAPSSSEQIYAYVYSGTTLIGYALIDYDDKRYFPSNLIAKGQTYTFSCGASYNALIYVQLERGEVPHWGQSNDLLMYNFNEDRYLKKTDYKDEKFSGYNLFSNSIYADVSNFTISIDVFSGYSYKYTGSSTLSSITISDGTNNLATVYLTSSTTTKTNHFVYKTFTATINSQKLKLVFNDGSYIQSSYDHIVNFPPYNIVNAGETYTFTCICSGDNKYFYYLNLEKGEVPHWGNLNIYDNYNLYATRFLPLSGGTLTGSVKFNNGITTKDGTGSNSSTYLLTTDGNAVAKSDIGGKDMEYSGVNLIPFSTMRYNNMTTYNNIYYGTFVHYINVSPDTYTAATKLYLEYSEPWTVLKEFDFISGTYGTYKYTFIAPVNACNIRLRLNDSLESHIRTHLDDNLIYKMPLLEKDKTYTISFDYANSGYATGNISQIYISNLKLEQGEVATGWNLNPLEQYLYDSKFFALKSHTHTISNISDFAAYQTNVSTNLSDNHKYDQHYVVYGNNDESEWAASDPANLYIGNLYSYLIHNAYIGDNREKVFTHYQHNNENYADITLYLTGESGRTYSSSITDSSISAYFRRNPQYFIIECLIGSMTFNLQCEDNYVLRTIDANASPTWSLNAGDTLELSIMLFGGDTEDATGRDSETDTNVISKDVTMPEATYYITYTYYPSI